jgi:hypothetical protein
MVCAVLIRRLRDGVSFEDFRAAWEPDQGFGVPTTVWHARSLDDEREIVSFGLMDLDREQVPGMLERFAASEARRHESIDHVIERMVFRGIYEVVAEVDLS